MLFAQFLGMESSLVALAAMGHSLTYRPSDRDLFHQKDGCPPAGDPWSTMLSAKRRDSSQDRLPQPIRCTLW